MSKNKTTSFRKYGLIYISLTGFIILSTAQSFARKMDDNFNDVYYQPNRHVTAPVTQPATKAPTVIKAPSPTPIAPVQVYVPAPAPTPAPAPAPVAPSSSPLAHLEYFGYYASAFEGVNKGNYTKEISNHANLTWIVNGDVVKKLKEAKALNMKAVVDIQWIFMDANLKLRSDMITNWKKFAKAIEPYRDTIAALYPLDEPYGNAKNKGVDDSTIKRNIEIMASIAKSTFPEIPIAVIFSPMEVYKSKPIPVGFDWIGFDCYGKFKDCYKDHGVSYYFNKLKARISGSQHMMLIPWGYKEGYVSQKDINDRNNAANDYWNLAQDSSVIAFIPFLYQSYADTGGDGKHISGVDEMPALLQNFTTMGQKILTAHPSGSARKPVVGVNHDVFGYVDGVQSLGKNNWVINGWACAQGINDSISIDLYVGGAAGAGGTGIARLVANKSSEDAVAAECRAIGSKYRFQIPIDSTLATKHGGKTIFVHGISPVGGSNNVLIKSGAYLIPKVSVTTQGSSGSFDGGGSSSGGHVTTKVYTCGKQNVSPTYCEVSYYCGKKKVAYEKTNVMGSYADYENNKYAVGSIINGFTIEGYTMLRSYYSFRCTQGGWIANDPNNKKNWCSVRKDLPTTDGRCK